MAMLNLNKRKHIEETPFLNEKQQKLDAMSSDDDGKEQQQLVPYNNDNDGYSLKHDDSGMLCIFTPLSNQMQKSMNKSITWLDKVVYNLRVKNTTVINYNDSYLKSGLDYLSTIDNIQQWHDRLYPDIDNSIVIVEPVGIKTTYTIGSRVKGKPSGFVFVDYGKIKRAKSVHGNFFSIQWNGIHYFNKIYSNIMEQYFKDDLPFKMESSVCLNLPEKVSEREILLRKFYNISRENNMKIYSSGELLCPVQTERVSMHQFDEMFEMNKTEGSSQEVEMLICAVVEGVKYGKIETAMRDINNKKYYEKMYSLAIKPILFFNIEQ
ncbi:Single-stranded DNA binding protein [Lonomia obliqua multiple nucleopolyhedrovirus]|uniref:Single-stranded DNA binding protein n=1 Tax=Lonomia obliqua multiple nucleopolyhedrovirus TaxID=134394 RepID=A0A126FC85_9ABAC|nr:Single-stranded DNA binding protein [Lonomia obliqua multiple nucleopolyhedrovirus]AKN81008.1 Single-stranded DNA binding protein [Lonomia obliqua multiple nucleopolyhedrovirus]